jgi:hypothetical protein
LEGQFFTSEELNNLLPSDRTGKKRDVVNSSAEKPLTRSQRRRAKRLEGRNLRKQLMEESETFHLEFPNAVTLRTFFAQSEHKLPKNVLDALNHEGWSAAVYKEYDALESLDSWTNISKEEAESL